MSARAARQQSAAFFAASDRCLTERPCGDETLWMIPVPGIVCAAISIELGFKALMMQAGGSTLKQHNLLLLFKGLRPRQQNELIKTVGLDPAAFESELRKMADAFIEWRYVYEYPDLEINFGFMDRLAKATQEASRSALGA